MAIEESAKPVKIFCCYSQSDKTLQQELLLHMSGLRRAGLIQDINSREIPAGTLWKEEIDQRPREANIILLLLSPEFITSNYCYSKETQAILSAHKSGDVHTIPILLRPVQWKQTPIGELKALPTNEKPVTHWSNIDEAFVDVVKGIHAIIKYGKKYDHIGHATTADEFSSTDRNAEQLEKALEAYEKAIALEKPPSYTLLEKKGLTLFALGNYEAAAKTYEEGRQYAPDNAALPRNLGDAFYALRQFEEARQAYREASEKDPQNAYLLARIGDTFLETPDVEQSLSWYDQAIALQSTSDSFGASVKASFYEKKGHALMRITKYKDALDAYEQTIMLDDMNADYFINQARALERLGTKQADRASFEKAVKAYEQALRLRPENYYVLIELGGVFFKLHRLGEALRAYEAAIRYEPDLRTAYLGKGNVLRQQANDLEKRAQEAYNQAESLDISRKSFSQE